MGSLSSRLCTACRKFNFKEMLSTESAEQDMGPLSDYGHPNCPFCRLIVAAVSRAGWDFVKLCSSTADKKTPRIFIQSWSPMTVMKNGHIEHPEPRLQLALDQRPDEFQLGRPTLRQLDRGKIRFIIAELESLPDKREKRFITRHSVGDRVDPALVQGWLRECNEQHSHSKRNRVQAQAVRNSLFQYKDGFLLIDVVDEQLVRKTEPCDYVALSYIWGGVQSFQTTTENIEKLTAGPGSLSASWLESFGGGEIPRTVLDAMEFTRQLGIRHAWVDTLCILQDETQEKARLIGRMDDIYDNATVTLIAGSGNNSQTGLKGVSVRDAGVPIDPETITHDKKRFNLAICPRSLCEEVRRSAWNTRCWTYQEQCLSQRCLYFTPHEVFFNCSKMQRREAYSAQIPDTGTEEATRYSKLEIRTGPPWWSRNLRKDLDPTPYRYMGDLMANKPSLADYQTAVQDYIRKKLTYQEDIFDAFEGIYNRFCWGDGDRVSIRLAQGIPRQFLWQAMLWFPSHSAKKRVARPDSPEWQAKRFSSWSW